MYGRRIYARLFCFWVHVVWNNGTKHSIRSNNIVSMLCLYSLYYGIMEEKLQQISVNKHRNLCIGWGFSQINVHKCANKSIYDMRYHNNTPKNISRNTELMRWQSLCVWIQNQTFSPRMELMVRMESLSFFNIFFLYVTENVGKFYFCFQCLHFATEYVPRLKLDVKRQF